MRLASLEQSEIAGRGPLEDPTPRAPLEHHQQPILAADAVIRGPPARDLVRPYIERVRHRRFDAVEYHGAPSAVAAGVRA